MNKFFSTFFVAAMMLTVSSFGFVKTKKTASGVEFKRVWEEDLKAAGVKDPKKFGEAWEDPSGMIWGDIAESDDGYALAMNHKDAEAYCAYLGAELPSGWPEDENGKYGFANRDSDFVRLRKYMGAEYAAGYENPRGYRAQILPNLITANQEREILNQWYWSSSLHPESSKFAYDFGGLDGHVLSYYRSFDEYPKVRCVVRAAHGVDR